MTPSPARTAPSRNRTIAGGFVTAGGVALLLLGLFGGASNALSLVGLGAVIVFVGVAVLSPARGRPRRSA